MSTQGSDNVKMDANIHVMLSQTKELQRPREAGRESQIRFFLSSHFHSKTYPDNFFCFGITVTGSGRKIFSSVLNYSAPGNLL